MADSTVLVTTAVSEFDEVTRAQALAQRYRCEFVDLWTRSVGCWGSASSPG
jgi:hypothetical protein